MMASETLNSPFNSPSSPLDSPKLDSPDPPPHPDHPNPLQSTFKSSNWLQRLRSSRGFPESHHIDLDHFLSTSTSPPPIIHPPIVRTTPLPDKCGDNGAVQERDLINNLLSDLFYMGEFENNPKIKRKKSCRKQQCPRLCVVPTDFDVPTNNVSARSLRFTSSSRRRKVKEVNTVPVHVLGEEEEKGHWDVSAYSQTEVMVIDTSVPCWKFEKVLYRRKNVWKVRDKKAKGLVSCDRNKRKERLNENDRDVPKKKKLKKKMMLCSSLKYVDREETMVSSKSDQVLM